MEKICIICSKEFKTNTSTKTCSEICKKENTRIKLAKDYQDNKEKRLEKRKEDFKKFHIENPDYRKEYMRKYRKTENNKNYNRGRTKTEKYKDVRNKRQRERYKQDPCYKLYNKIRTSLKKNLKGKSKSCSSPEYLGCNFEEWKIYLEQKFDDKMNWNNHGIYWDIDHIKPLSSFDFTKEEELKIAFNYKNTQPLESFYNRHIKRDKYE